MAKSAPNKSAHASITSAKGSNKNGAVHKAIKKAVAKVTPKK